MPRTSALVKRPFRPPKYPLVSLGVPIRELKTEWHRLDAEAQTRAGNFTEPYLGSMTCRCLREDGRFLFLELLLSGSQYKGCQKRGLYAKNGGNPNRLYAINGGKPRCKPNPSFSTYSPTLSGREAILGPPQQGCYQRGLLRSGRRIDEPRFPTTACNTRSAARGVYSPLLHLRAVAAAWKTATFSMLSLNRCRFVSQNWTPGKYLRPRARCRGLPTSESDGSAG